MIEIIQKRQLTWNGHVKDSLNYKFQGNGMGTTGAESYGKGIKNSMNKWNQAEEESQNKEEFRNSLEIDQRSPML